MRANKEQRVRIHAYPLKHFSGMRSGFNQMGLLLRKYEAILFWKTIQKIITEKS